MRTEYDTAVSTAIGASRYYEMQSMIETLPYWEYQSAGDKRVRDAHRKLNGMIFRADDNIWNTIYPPNGWKCRCEVVAHADIPKGKRLNQGSEAIQKLKDTQVTKKDNEYDIMRKSKFDKNRAITATAFDESAFYAKKFNVKLGIKDFYGSDRLKYNNIDKASLPALNSKYKSNTDAKDDLLEKLDDKKRIVVKDNQKRAISLSESTINTHLSDKTKYKDRYKYADQINNILANPDEIWLKQVKGNKSEYVYMKFYQKEMVGVFVGFEPGGMMEIKTFFDIDPKKESSFRSGILIKRFK